MKKSELKKLMGKVVKYQSNRTRIGIFQTSCGAISDISRSEVLINGDWHDIKTLNVLEVVE
jgi:hypothetical protein